MADHAEGGSDVGAVDRLAGDDGDGARGRVDRDLVDAVQAADLLRDNESAMLAGHPVEVKGRGTDERAGRVLQHGERLRGWWVARLFETAVHSAGIAPVVSPGLVCPASAGYAQRVLAGRDRERAAVASLIDQARASRGAALVLRGLPGVGKSALIDDAVSTAEGLLVLRTSGIESESPLAFAALQRLLRPVMPLADRLPLPQAAALRAAFGEAEGDGDRFLVFLAALSLLAEAAEEAPVLAVVQPACPFDELFECFPSQTPSRRSNSSGRPKVEDRSNVRVTDACRCTSFAQEAKPRRFTTEISLS